MVAKNDSLGMKMIVKKEMLLLVVIFMTTACGLRFKNEHKPPVGSSDPEFGQKVESNESIETPVEDVQEPPTDGTNNEIKPIEGNEREDDVEHPSKEDIDAANISLNYRVYSPEANKYFLIIDKHDELVKSVVVFSQKSGIKKNYLLKESNKIALDVDSSIDITFLTEDEQVVKNTTIKIPSDHVVYDVQGLKEISVLPKSVNRKIYVKSVNPLNLNGENFRLNAQEIIFQNVTIFSDDENISRSTSPGKIEIVADKIYGKLNVILVGTNGKANTVVPDPLVAHSKENARERNCCFNAYNNSITVSCPSIRGTNGKAGGSGKAPGLFEIISGTNDSDLDLTISAIPGKGGAGAPGGAGVSAKYYNNVQYELGISTMPGYTGELQRYMYQCNQLHFWGVNKSTLYNQYNGSFNGENGSSGADSRSYQYCTTFNNRPRTCEAKTIGI